MHTDITSLRRGFTGQILLPDEDWLPPGHGGSGTRWQTSVLR